MKNAAVPFPQPLAAVKLRRRINRFVVSVTAESGEELQLHLPNSGRMQELLTPGTPGLAYIHGSPTRRTAGTLLLVRYQGRWVSVDAHMPNRLFVRGIAAGVLKPFLPCTDIRKEVTVRRVRLDFLLTSPDGSRCLVEAKSCNLVEDGIALFPDAPTLRGTNHLEVLTDSVKQGQRGALVWFVQRDDARQLRPHRAADPEFAAAVERAALAGVELYAYRCQVSPHRIAILDEIPVVTG